MTKMPLDQGAVLLADAARSTTRMHKNETHGSTEAVVPRHPTGAKMTKARRLMVAASILLITWETRDWFSGNQSLPARPVLDGQVLKLARSQS